MPHTWPFTIVQDNCKLQYDLWKFTNTIQSFSIHFRLVKNDFFDDLKMTETFAAFCGDGLSFLLCKKLYCIHLLLLRQIFFVILISVQFDEQFSELVSETKHHVQANLHCWFKPSLAPFEESSSTTKSKLGSGFPMLNLL